MENIYVMVTGPAASGKSTLCDNLCVNLPAFFYKPANAYFDLAKMNNIPKDRIFYDTDLDEMANHFCKVCLEHDIVVGDQHLAIQHGRDSALAVNNIEAIDPNEPFVSALDYSLFDTMLEKSIQPIIIYLNADPEILYERAYKRNIEIGHILRNRNLQEVRDEINAERDFFEKLITSKNLDNLVINTSLNDAKKVYDEAKKKVLEYKIK